MKKAVLILLVIVLGIGLKAQSDYALVISADLDCIVKLDGKLIGKVLKGEKKEVDVTKGVHMVNATTLDGYYKVHKEVNVKSVKEFVEINLSSKIAETIENDKLLRKHDMVFVEGGQFIMGDKTNDGDRDEHLHKVMVNSFYIGKYEVTVEKFRQFVDATDHETRAEKDGWAYNWNGSLLAKEYGTNWRNISTDPKAPVTCVSWLDAVKYCNWLSEKDGFNQCYTITEDTVVAFNTTANGYRLPTEAEWEFAARGGRKSKDYKFSGGNKGYDQGWVKENADYKVHRVGTKAPNELGIYDMSGNTSEWCYDRYYKDYYLSDGGIHKNPIGPEDGNGRVQRGGGILFPVRYSRVANRQMATENEKGMMDGFRIVRNI